MKIFIYFVLFFTSLHLYADDSQIILDPLEGIPEIEMVPYEQEYTKECILTKITGGYSQDCTIKRIIYSTIQKEKNRSGVRSINTVEQDLVDKSYLQVYPLEKLQAQSSFSQECVITGYQYGLYLDYEESCNVLEREADNEGQVSSEDYNRRIEQRYIKECTLTKIEEGYSKNCIIKDITYMIKEECSFGNSSNDSFVMCSEDGKVEMDFVDELYWQRYPLEKLQVQSGFSQRCKMEIGGSYEEDCSIYKRDDNLKEEQGLSEDYDSHEEVDEDIGKEDSSRQEIVVPESVEKAIGGIGQIVVVKEDEQDGISNYHHIGSGFSVEDAAGQPVVITNYHVVKSMLLNLFQMNVPDQDWFSETSKNNFYFKQDRQPFGNNTFRIKGIRDMFRLMDLAVLEVENYTGSTLSIADNYANEVPAYILGYPGGVFF